jgi:hypothetical protein
VTLKKEDGDTEILKLGGPEESVDLNIDLIPEFFRHIQSAAFIGDAAGTAMLLGILCFFVSVQCLAVTTQPLGVWIVSAAICSLVIILPVGNRLLGVLSISKFHLCSLGDA